MELRRHLDRVWQVLALLVVALGLMATSALADGDPGSDVLVYQPSFVPPDAQVPIADQVRLSGMLRQAAHTRDPIRVAIIAHRDDLGAVTALWRQPQAYAHFLGVELSLGYKGQLLVVMPNGFGVNWPGHSTAAARQALARIPIRPGGTGMVTAALQGAQALDRRLGVRLRPAAVAGGAGSAPAHTRPAVPTITAGPAPVSRATTGAHAGSGHTALAIAIGAAAVIAVVALALLFVLRDRWRPALRPAMDRARGLRSGRIRLLPVALVGAAVLVLAVLVLVIHGSPSTPTATALADNPVLDPGAPLSGKAAPDFTLYDQIGRRVSLHQFRGKVTLLDFNDSECTTVCPLTTTAMLDARRMLGPAARHVQLLGVDANPKATEINDVLSYTQLHGLTGKWQFLTGSLPQLQKVWREYGIQADIQRGLISHTPALFVLDTHGRLRRLYITQQNYAAVGQLGQELAREVSDLLPGHPAVHSHLSYRVVPNVTPKQSFTMPRSGGGRLTVSPGKPHLYLFFDTWNRETTNIAAELDGLNAYADGARKAGLPPLTAIDEGSVEPSPAALPGFLHTLPHPLRYPVAIDTTGRVADGYQVQGEPWMVLTSASGKILWYDAIETSPWPTVARLRFEVRAALSPAGHGPPLQEQLIGSPRPLAKLHAQASRLLGAEPQLLARVRALQGYPIVINAWESFCEPCQKEFGLFAQASLQFGRQVAFIGADADSDRADGQGFLRQHPVSYPSYTIPVQGPDALLKGGIEGYPTTIYIDRDGQVAFVHDGQYSSQGVLNSDINRIALDSR
jgi:cytochrome oxidase Cu insertion factor (SCO1/SenC/PrrC family)/thiol-disulfide isomerase/thioredoxin